MKKVFLLFTFVVLLITTNNTISKQWTVSSNPNLVAQFTGLQTALDSASAGDTIYVYNSTVNYGTVNINKKITVYGAGYYGAVSANQVVSYCTFNILSDSVTIKGFYGTVTVAGNGVNIKNVTISNILGDISLVNVNGCLIYNCLSDNISVSQSYNSDNIIVTNCIIKKFTSYKGNVLITNNIFPIVSGCPWGGESIFGTGDYCASPSKYLTIENNIFLKASPSYAAFSSFNNNLTYSTNQNTLPYGNNTGDNNIINQDPKFIGTNLQNWSYVNQIVSNWLNFNLADDSPAKNAGTDSTDIGISGGMYPWPKLNDLYLDFYGTPNLPTITSFNLKNTIVGQDGNLKLNVKGKKGK